MEFPLLLSPENIFFDIYLYLWTKKIKEPIFSFLIPDTILYIENKPVLWIFPSKSGAIKRKLKDKLTTEHIIKKFSKKKAELIAYYFYHKEKQITLIENFENNEKDDTYSLMQFLKEMDIEIPKENNFEDNRKNLKFEFFENEITLKTFLETFKKRMGILQLFINSNQDPNTMFRIFWTPKSKIYDMRRSRKPLHRQVHFYEKCVTYETERFNINTELIKSPLVQKKLEKATLEIVEQLESLYKRTFKIKSIILHFKESKKEELFFTYCTGIYLVQYESLEKNNSIWKGLFFEADISEKFYFDITKHEYEKTYNLTADYRCVHCNKIISSDHAKLIDYKCLLKFEKMMRVEDNMLEPSNNKDGILKMFENRYNQPVLIHHFDAKLFNDRQENRGNSFFPLKVAIMRNKNSVIPHAIRNIQKKITKEKYERLKDDIFFTEKKVRVCEECYIELTRIYYFTKDEYNSSVISEKIKLKINSSRKNFQDITSKNDLKNTPSLKDKDISVLKSINTSSTNIIRVQSALGSKIELGNRTRNISTALDSKKYLSTNRCTSSKSNNKSNRTDYSSYFNKDQTDIYKTGVNSIKPKIFSDKGKIIEVSKKRIISLFNH